jgi:hypothetical protein
MRKLFSSKKRIAMAAGLLVVAIGASAAFAYWTASGTGNGTAHAGSDAGVSITSVVFSGGPDITTPGTLYPGATVKVAFDVNNLSPNTSVNVHKVVTDQGAVLSGTGTLGDPYVYTWPNGIEITSPAAAVAGCNPSWFTYSGTTLAATPGQPIAASGTYSAPAGSGTGNGGTLSMSNETSTNQDACKTAVFKLHLKTDNSGI